MYKELVEYIEDKKLSALNNINLNEPEEDDDEEYYEEYEDGTVVGTADVYESENENSEDDLVIHFDDVYISDNEVKFYIINNKKNRIKPILAEEGSEGSVLDYPNNDTIVHKFLDILYDKQSNNIPVENIQDMRKFFDIKPSMGFKRELRQPFKPHTPISLSTLYSLEAMCQNYTYIKDF